MKARHCLGCLAATAIAFAPVVVRAGEEPKNPAFERLKSLEGHWVGPAVWDEDGQKGEVEFEVSYRVTSGGSVVL